MRVRIILVLVLVLNCLAGAQVRVVKPFPVVAKNTEPRVFKRVSTYYIEKGGLESRVYVDTLTFNEDCVVVAGKLGWIGKHADSVLVYYQPFSKEPYGWDDDRGNRECPRTTIFWIKHAEWNRLDSLSESYRLEELRLVREDSIRRAGIDREKRLVNDLLDRWGKDAPGRKR